ARAGQSRTSTVADGGVRRTPYYVVERFLNIALDDWTTFDHRALVRGVDLLKLRVSRFIDFMEADIVSLMGAEDGETFKQEVNMPPLDPQSPAGRREGSRSRRRRRKMTAQQAQAIAEMAEQYDKEVTRGR